MAKTGFENLRVYQLAEKIADLGEKNKRTMDNKQLTTYNKQRAKTCLMN